MFNVPSSRPPSAGARRARPRIGLHHRFWGVVKILQRAILYARSAKSLFPYRPFSVARPNFYNWPRACARWAYPCLSDGVFGARSQMPSAVALFRWSPVDLLTWVLPLLLFW